MPRPHRQPLPPTPVIRVLRSAGCASWRLAVDDVRSAMRAVGMDGEPEVLLVNGYNDGVKYAFRGSPTVTVDGVDVDPHPPGQPGLAFG